MIDQSGGLETSTMAAPNERTEAAIMSMISRRRLLTAGSMALFTTPGLFAEELRLPTPRLTDRYSRAVDLPIGFPLISHDFAGSLGVLSQPPTYAQGRRR